MVVVGGGRGRRNLWGGGMVGVRGMGMQDAVWLAVVVVGQIDVAIIIGVVGLELVAVGAGDGGIGGLVVVVVITERGTWIVRVILDNRRARRFFGDDDDGRKIVLRAPEGAFVPLRGRYTNPRRRTGVMVISGSLSG